MRSEKLGSFGGYSGQHFVQESTSGRFQSLRKWSSGGFLVDVNWVKRRQLGETTSVAWRTGPPAWIQGSSACPPDLEIKYLVA